MKIWLIVSGIALVVFIFWQLKYALLIGIKEPAYTVQQKEGYELREYAPYITASVTVSGSYSEAGNEGFRILAGYIFGKNSANAAVPMTVPVLQEADTSVQIAMTAPVLMQEGSEPNSYRVTFVLPADYTLDTVPQPVDTRITLAQRPARRVAAYRFTWYPTAARVAEKTKELSALLARDGLRTEGAPAVARYNPPWVLPFLLRNELLIAVQ